MTLFTAPLPRTRSLKLRRDLVRKAVLERNQVPA
jgi:acyl-coenzyme A synthetase/AMP-(fatty) acid ligase